MISRTIKVLSLATLLPVVSAAETNTLTFGPVALHEGSRFEVCANSKYAEYDVILTASFVRIKNGKSITREVRLDPGEGGCFKLPYEKAGSAPVFAAIEVLGEPGDTDIIASAAIINGLFELPKPQVLLQDEGLTTATTFGPLQIPEGKRIKVCANNWKSTYTSTVTVNFYRVGDSVEPILSKDQALEHGQGGCVSLSQAQVGKGAIIAELLTWPVEPGFSNPMPVTGAFIINGIFEAPVPAQTRFLPE